jgi:hypothetical protein
MTPLYRVVEKKFNSDRTNFVLEGGVWLPSLERARESASRIAQTTLAHRLFIVRSGAAGKSVVLEEVELVPLVQRLAHVHKLVLSARNPGRLASELDSSTGVPVFRKPRAPRIRRRST